MKKVILSIVSLAFGMAVSAQNIQLHYDLGHSFYGDLNGRPNVTTTIEMFKPDKWGSTFLFTDIDYFSDGAAGAYWEIWKPTAVSPSIPSPATTENTWPVPTNQVTTLPY